MVPRPRDRAALDEFGTPPSHGDAQESTVAHTLAREVRSVLRSLKEKVEGQCDELRRQIHDDLYQGELRLAPYFAQILTSRDDESHSPRSSKAPFTMGTSSCWDVGGRPGDVAETTEKVATITHPSGRKSWTYAVEARQRAAQAAANVDGCDASGMGGEADCDVHDVPGDEHQCASPRRGRIRVVRPRSPAVDSEGNSPSSASRFGHRGNCRSGNEDAATAHRGVAASREVTVVVADSLITPTRSMLHDPHRSPVRSPSPTVKITPMHCPPAGKGSELEDMGFQDVVHSSEEASPTTSNKYHSSTSALAVPTKEPNRTRSSLMSNERTSDRRSSKRRQSITSAGFEEKRCFDRWLFRIGYSWELELLVTFMIFANCTVMGIQAQNRIRPVAGDIMTAFLTESDHFFTGFFFIEFLLRVRVFGCKSFKPTNADGRAACMDAFLAIVCGVCITWVLPLFSLIVGFDANGAVFRTLTVLRAARIARIVRVFRGLAIFREAWMLIRGLSDSARTLFWTIVVIFFVTYAFAILGLGLFVDDLSKALQEAQEAGSQEDVDRITALLGMYAGVDRMMYTLVQVLCQDSFHQFMRDTLMYLWWSWLYFYAYIAVGGFVLMNLVTAIIVENAMEVSRGDHEQLVKDKEARNKKEIAELRTMFNHMDTDGSGTINWIEFRDSFTDDLMHEKWLLLDFQQDDCQDLFRMLDDGDGEIDVNEFFDGLQKLRGPALSRDLLKVSKGLARLEKQMDAFSNAL